MKLKKFRKDEVFKKNVIKLVGAFIFVGIVSASISYAVYQKVDEVQFINATVRWPKASEVTYTNTSNSSVTNVEPAVNDLYGKLGK